MLQHYVFAPRSYKNGEDFPSLRIPEVCAVLMYKDPYGRRDFGVSQKYVPYLCIRALMVGEISESV